MNIILIDTDVILDFFFDRQPFAEDASQILVLCEKNVIKGFVTPVMISNLYYLLRKTAKHDKVIEHLKMLMNIINITSANKKAVIEALHSEFKDFEDALQYYSAKNQKNIKVIVTRNIKDYVISTMPVMTPETYLKAIK
ncbi:MAG: PIN domain-containing protein [Cytophagales bacterium]|nr:PIN domain-containing protein [Cytophagales bacterium]